VPVTWTGPIDGSGVNVTIKANNLEQVYYKAREINSDFGQATSHEDTEVTSNNLEARDVDPITRMAYPSIPAALVYNHAH